MGLPIPWWPVSLCAVILTSPFKTLRQEEMRHTIVWIELFPGDRKEARKIYEPASDQVMGQIFSRPIGLSKPTCGAESTEWKALVTDTSEKGIFRWENRTTPSPGRKFLQIHLSGHVNLHYRPLGGGGILTLQQNCVCCFTLDHPPQGSPLLAKQVIWFRSSGHTQISAFKSEFWTLWILPWGRQLQILGPQFLSCKMGMLIISAFPHSLEADIKPVLDKKRILNN